MRTLDGSYKPGSVQCETCIHYEGNLKCKAFPDGIPLALWNFVLNHDDPYPGDHGIRYVLDER